MAEQISLFDGNEDELPHEEPRIPERVQSGDLWQLGKHRLLCGDATRASDVQQLLQGSMVQLGLHDPPYGLRARMAWGFGDGKMGGLARRGAFMPVYNDDKPFDPQHLLTSGKVVVIWGANHFAEKLPSSPAWIVWDKRVELPSNDMSDGEVAWVSTGNTLRIIRHKWNGFDRASERGEPRFHPTQKPIYVLSNIIKRYTAENDAVTDWYAGSGTTLIAAECTKRRAAAIEIEPHYCNVILHRWEQMTGKRAVLLERVGQAENSSESGVA
jgi:hypothetical protein